MTLVYFSKSRRACQQYAFILSKKSCQSRAAALKADFLCRLARRILLQAALFSGAKYPPHAIEWNILVCLKSLHKPLDVTLFALYNMAIRPDGRRRNYERSQSFDHSRSVLLRTVFAHRRAADHLGVRHRDRRHPDSGIVHPHRIQGGLDLPRSDRRHRAHLRSLAKGGAQIRLHLHRISGQSAPSRPHPRRDRQAPRPRRLCRCRPGDGGRRQTVCRLCARLPVPYGAPLLRRGHHFAQHHRGMPDDRQGVQDGIRPRLYRRPARRVEQARLPPRRVDGRVV